MPDKQSAALAIHVREALRQRLAGTGALPVHKRAAFSALRNTQSKRLRRELLNLRTDEGLRRWQILHNDTERYEVISSKDSDQKGETHCHIIYYELGDDLPMVKSEEDLKEDDKDREELTD